MTERAATDEERALRERHHPGATINRPGPDFGKRGCDTCLVAWPCEVGQALAIADEARAGLGHTTEWYAVRQERLRAFAAEHGWLDEWAAIVANGTTRSSSSPVRPPTYAQLLNLANWRAAQAAEVLAALVDGLSADGRTGELDDLVGRARETLRRCAAATPGDATDSELRSAQPTTPAQSDPVRSARARAERAARVAASHIEPLDADFEGEWYRWRCPECETIVELEWDPRGEIATCDVCGTKVRVG